VLGDGNNSAFADFLRRFLHHEFEQTVINLSLGIVVGAILVAVILSLIFPQRKAADSPEGE